MPVGCHRAQGGGLGAAGRVQINAVEIVAGLFGGDRKLRPVDQPLHVGGRKRERMRHVAGGKIGEIVFRKRLQREARAAGADRQHRAVAVALQHDLRAFGQLAHDVVKHMRRHRRRTGGGGFRRERLRNLQIKVGGLQRQPRAFSPDQHIAEDRNGVAALDHAVDVAQRFQELRTFDGNLHCNTRLILRWKSRAAGRRAAASEPESLIKAGLDQAFGGTARWRGWPASARDASRRSPRFGRRPQVPRSQFAPCRP